MLSTWSVLWAAFAIIVSAAPDYYGNYVQPQSIEADAPAGFDCSGKDDGAHGAGCSKDYWLCWQGVATSQECPENYMFNDANGECDYPANVFACSGDHAATTFASDFAEMPAVNFDCSGLEDGDYSFSQSCQPHFVSCVAGAPWERSCPEDLSFDFENRICDRLENIVACGGSPLPTIASDFAEMPAVNFDCSGLENGDYSYSQSCQATYVSCVDSAAWERTCPDDLSFDFENRICDRLENIVACGGYLPTAPAEVLSDFATPLPGTLVDFDCTNMEDGNYAFKNGDVCQPRFASCVSGIAYEIECPEGLMFDPDQMLCERIEAIVACGGTPEPITTVAYSYETTTPAAEPATLKSYGYETPAAKPISQRRQQVKSDYQTPAAEPTTESSYGGYQTETLAAQPTARRQIKTNYQTPAVKPAIRVAAPKILAASSYQTSGYQTPAAIRVAEPKTRVSSAYQTPAAIRSHIKTDGGYQTKTLVANKLNARRLNAGGYQTANVKPIVRQSSQNYETSTPAADFPILDTYGSYQAPAAEPTRHIKTARVAAQTTRASYGYQAPAIESTTPAADEQTTLSNDYSQTFEEAPTTRRYQSFKSIQTTTPAADDSITLQPYNSYAAEPTARRHMKKTALLAEPTRQSYYQATTPAAEPTTLSSYGDYQTETLAAQPTARRQIKTNYQAPAVKPAIRVAAPKIQAASSYQTSGYQTPAAIRVAEPKTRASSAYQTPAARPAIRRRIQTNGGYQTKTLVAAKSNARNLNAGGYQTPNVKSVVRQSNYQTNTPAADSTVLNTYGAYQAPAAEPTTRRQLKTLAAKPATYQSYGSQTTLAAEPTAKSSYGSYQTETLTALHTARRQMKKNNYQTPAVKPAIRRQMKTSRLVAPKTRASSSYQTPAAIPAIRRQIQTNGGYQQTNVKPIVRQSTSYEAVTPVNDDLSIFGLLSNSYQKSAAEPTIRRQMLKSESRQSYGQTTTPAAEPITTESSYGSSDLSLNAEPTTRAARKWFYKKVYIDEPTTRTPIKLQQQQSSY